MYASVHERHIWLGLGLAKQNYHLGRRLIWIDFTKGF